ncbi:hypothetical protein [Crateriforma conspicua]|nr:hypothetical protein [Crateriforma conspicua]
MAINRYSPACGCGPSRWRLRYPQAVITGLGVHQEILAEYCPINPYDGFPDGYQGKTVYESDMSVQNGTYPYPLVDVSGASDRVVTDPVELDYLLNTTPCTGTFWYDNFNKFFWKISYPLAFRYGTSYYADGSVASGPTPAGYYASPFGLVFVAPEDCGHGSNIYTDGVLGAPSPVSFSTGVIPLLIASEPPVESVTGRVQYDECTYEYQNPNACGGITYRTFQAFDYTTVVTWTNEPCS